MGTDTDESGAFRRRVDNSPSSPASASPERDVVAATFKPRTKAAAKLARAKLPLPGGVTLMTRAAVARAMALSELSVYRMTRSGLLRSLKLGSDPRSPVRYKADDIAAFINSRLDATE